MYNVGTEHVEFHRQSSFGEGSVGPLYGRVQKQSSNLDYRPSYIMQHQARILKTPIFRAQFSLSPLLLLIALPLRVVSKALSYTLRYRYTAVAINRVTILSLTESTTRLYARWYVLYSLATMLQL